MPGRNEEFASVAIGLGGNLGDPQSAFVRALESLIEEGSLQIDAVSSIWKTPPWGVTDQPDYLNACALGRTGLKARAFLGRMLAVETVEGRIRSERWGPRTIDLDLLFHADQRLDEEGLTLPHPRIAERAFVLLPLAEIAPDWKIDGNRIADLASVADSRGLERLKAAEEWWRKPERRG